MDIEKVRSRFIKHFDGKTGNIYMSPGRINLIGEHTDYNGGFVFPGAVDKGIMAEIRPNGTDTVMLYSIDLKDRVEFKVNDPEGPRASWARYIYGICQEMKALGKEEKSLRYVLSQPTNKNYTVDFRIEENAADVTFESLSAAYYTIYFHRGRFLDIVGQLHASYKFSPYLRLPFQGVEINRELSFVAPSISERLCKAKDKESLEKIMKQVGAKIVEGSLSQDAQKMLKECT